MKKTQLFHIFIYEDFSAEVCSTASTDEKHRSAKSVLILIEGILHAIRIFLQTER